MKIKRNETIGIKQRSNTKPAVILLFVTLWEFVLVIIIYHSLRRSQKCIWHLDVYSSRPKSGCRLWKADGIDSLTTIVSHSVPVTSTFMYACFHLSPRFLTSTIPSSRNSRLLSPQRPITTSQTPPNSQSPWSASPPTPPDSSTAATEAVHNTYSSSAASYPPPRFSAQ